MLFRKYKSFALSWIQECSIKSSLAKALSIHIKPQGIPGAENCSMSKEKHAETTTAPTPKLQQHSSALPGRAMGPCLLQFSPYTEEILVWFSFVFFCLPQNPEGTSSEKRVDHFL